MNFLFNGTVKDDTKFKNFIKSVRTFPFTKAMFYVDNQTSEDIKLFLENTLDCDVVYANTVNKTQAEWQSLYDDIDSEYVWACSRYDHCFVDQNTQHLLDVLKFRSDAGTDKLASISLSNWLECLTNCVIIDHGIWDGEKHPAPTQAWITVDQCDSFQIATKSLFHAWLFDQDFKNMKFTSLEELNYKADFIRPWKIQVPLLMSMILIIQTSQKKIKKRNLQTIILVQYLLMHVI